MCVPGRRGTMLDTGTNAYLERDAAKGYRIDLSGLLDEIAAKVPPPLPQRFQVPGKE